MKKGVGGQTPTGLACPCCGRDYELPRRYMMQPGDFDFCPIPRLMPCLHTVCHSCLQDQFERSSERQVVCGVCKHAEPIKGVGNLPLDFNTMRRIADRSKTELMTVCARCYDSIPSMSWCESCSSALCEFHHQDHRLSVDTAKHVIHTFKEAAYLNHPLDFCFPPMPCPEQPQADCQLFCQSCGYLVSAQAGLLSHASHPLHPWTAVVDEMTQLVQTAAEQANLTAQRLRTEIQYSKAAIAALDKCEESGVQAIQRTFSQLINQLKRRQKELTASLTQELHAQRQLCLKKLAELQEQVHDLNRVHTCATALLDGTAAARASPPDASAAAEAMYLVAAAETVDFRVEMLVERAQQCLHSLIVQADASDAGNTANLSPTRKKDTELFQRYGLKSPQVYFLPEDLSTHSALANTLGDLRDSSADSQPAPEVTGQSSSSSPLFFAVHLDSETGGTTGTARPPQPPPGRGTSNGLAEDLPAPGGASRHQTVCIEARQLTPTIVLSSEESLEADKKETLLSKWRAPLLGKVVLHIDEGLVDEGKRSLQCKWQYLSRRDNDRPELTIHLQLAVH